MYAVDCPRLCADDNAPYSARPMMPMTKYFALIRNGSGNSMISESPCRIPKASSRPKMPPEAPTVRVLG